MHCVVQWQLMFLSVHTCVYADCVHEEVSVSCRVVQLLSSLQLQLCTSSERVCTCACEAVEEGLAEQTVHTRRHACGVDSTNKMYVSYHIHSPALDVYACMYRKKYAWGRRVGEQSCVLPIVLLWFINSRTLLLTRILKMHVQHALMKCHQRVWISIGSFTMESS